MRRLVARQSTQATLPLTTAGAARPAAPQSSEPRLANPPPASDPFKVTAFLPPPQQTQAAPPALSRAPPAPVAPPFPYVYFGRFTDGAGQVSTFLELEGELLAIQPGQLLPGEYRIDDVSQQQMSITYLPLNETTVIRLQSAEN